MNINRKKVDRIDGHIKFTKLVKLNFIKFKLKK